MADTLGWLGCVCFALCGVPQAWKSYKDGHSFGLTYAFIALWLGGEIFFIGGTLLKFGWVGWIMWNCVFNTLAILVIAYYRIRPRFTFTPGWGDEEEETENQEVGTCSGRCVAG